MQPSGNIPYTDHYIDGINGSRFHYVEWELPNKASYADDFVDVFLQHGAWQTCHTWDDFVEQLAGDEYSSSKIRRIVAIDLRGNGDSDHSPQYDYHVMVKDTLELMEKLHLLDTPEHSVMIGMSLGGLLTLGALESKSLAAKVRAAVIVDVTPTIAEIGKSKLQKNMKASKSLSSFDDYVNWATRVNPDRSEDILRNRLLHALRETSDGTWTFKYDPTFDGLALAEQSTYLWDQMAQIAVPVLLVRGGNSSITDIQDCYRMRDLIPRGQFVEIPKAGHSVQGDQPALLAQHIMAFVNGAREGTPSAQQ